MQIYLHRYWVSRVAFGPQWPDGKVPSSELAASRFKTPFHSRSVALVVLMYVKSDIEGQAQNSPQPHQPNWVSGESRSEGNHLLVRNFGKGVCGSGVVI
ncbi:hypothetical protein AVEN_109596-1 [Araneus ventricosus]|uniref:Uncharacterized protein n=1 Tax=Araneus ventricosus TaxID=182803 RepID=A0A4Y2J697_ARAVE|nr:hypothetical protein AVEN_6375-1 [Araneus ventricosus]GBM84772.1 hypothetical protein AVEN_189750-1 [Araneus ventricosus]GBM84893.1 hypothetical protein AVEN_56231-1 [Araneus ventricosus]GBM84969.1 hypothetical protein AVEN_109596-1 [Araneus ventricosus]